MRLVFRVLDKLLGFERPLNARREKEEMFYG